MMNDKKEKAKSGFFSNLFGQKKDDRTRLLAGNRGESAEDNIYAEPKFGKKPNTKEVATVSTRTLYTQL